MKIMVSKYDSSERLLCNIADTNADEVIMPVDFWKSILSECEPHNYFILVVCWASRLCHGIALASQ